MRKSSCFLITKKPLLLDGRKSHFFWMIIPTSSGNRESGLFFLATGPKKPLYTPVTGKVPLNMALRFEQDSNKSDD